MRAFPSPPVVVMLTTFPDDEYLVAASRAGAGGYLLKSMPPGQIVASLRAAMSGQVILAPSMIEKLVRDTESRLVPPDPRLESLTPKEREVLALIARGRSNDEIGRDLFISEGTVKTHVAAILRKLGVRDRVQAAVVAVEAGSAPRWTEQVESAVSEWGVGAQASLSVTVDCPGQPGRRRTSLGAVHCAATKCRVMVRRLGRVPAWAIWRGGTLRAT